MTNQQSYTERLRLVRIAIDRILAGHQSVSYADRQYTRANLGQLQALEQRYERLARQEAAQLSGRGRSAVRYIRF